MREPVLPVEEWPMNKISKIKKEIIEQVVDESLQNINDLNQRVGALREEIARTLYLEKVRIKKEPWDVDPPDEYGFWSKIKKELVELDQSDLEKEEIANVEQKILKRIVSRYANEIQGSFSPRMYSFARTILTHFFARLFNASTGKIKNVFRPRGLLEDKLNVTGPIDKIRSLATKGTLILLPTHFSNLDSILIGYGMDTIGLPAFQYGAGLNLYNSQFFGFFMNQLGGYKLDRRKKNQFYLETLKAFSRTNIYHGSNTLFFPGGTRSRSGGLETKLKLGLLGTVIDTQRRHVEEAENGNYRKIFILPMTMSYHFVLEAKTLIEEHLKRTGKELYITIDDEFTSYKKLSKFFYQTFNASSDITLSLSDPIDIFGNFVDENGDSFDMHGNPIDLRAYFQTRGEIKPDKQREREYTRLLGQEVRKRFFTANTVYNSHLVAFTAFEMLKKRFSRADLYTLLNTPEEEREIPYDDFVIQAACIKEELFKLKSEGRLKLAPHLSKNIEDIVHEGIKNLGIYHGDDPLKRTEYGEITSEDMKLLYFYRNRLEGYGLSKYIK